MSVNAYNGGAVRYLGVGLNG